MIRAASLRARVDGIVIGTSAGGVEALTVLLPALPRSLTASVFIVMHLPRDRASGLVEIFRPRCALPIEEAYDKTRAEPGTVYFAPPDYHLLLDEGPQLSLSSDEPVHFSRPSIDVLFESAADVYGRRLMGVILTGANQDGAAGLLAVHRAGGVTVVQEPQSAKASLMITSALACTPADFVLPLDGIAELFRTLGGEDAILGAVRHDG